MVMWRQSASLILLANKQTKNIHGKKLFDYSTLLLKRSPKMRFAPDVSAFPGGKLDPYDLSLEWPKYLSSSINIERFSKKIADIYHDIDHPYPGLAFRLCAIRETFEETGLLLAKSRTSSDSQYATIQNLSDNIINQWRDKIRQDASQFLVMCKEIQVEPDVHSLTEWTQYLAAAMAKVRYDTIFYVATLPKTYPCIIKEDDHETVSAEWFEPDVAMNKYHDNSLNFLPPQVYELSRLANFYKLSDLINYLSQCKTNSNFYIKRLLGICYKIPEATILVMPGDDHYPSDATFSTPIITSKTKVLKDFDSKNQNRLIMMHHGDNKKFQVHYKIDNTDNKDDFDIKPLNYGWEKS